MLAGADQADHHGVMLEYLQVTTGKGVKSVASIGLDIAGQKFEELHLAMVLWMQPSVPSAR